MPDEGEYTEIPTSGNFYGFDKELFDKLMNKEIDIDTILHDVYDNYAYSIHINLNNLI
ncbi:MAG TPA: hypothetical protein PLV83_05320 [Bacilli bacterium]|nr:hypothetical protein [Bacilli bacterium]